MPENEIPNAADILEVKPIPDEILKFEKYKYKIGLLKWVISSVALVAMTTIIDCGFKERAVGMQEIQQYDKYVSELLVLNKDPGQKRMLAQFFSNVTPSKTLRDGWEKYFNKVDEEYRKSIAVILVQDSIAKVKAIKLALLDTLTTAQEAQKQKLDVSIAKYESLKNPPIVLPDAGTQAGDYLTATYYESKGFNSLIKDRDVDKAILNFESSNRVYNTFRQVYEIANYLKSMRSKLLDKNAAEWKTTYTTLANKYNWGMSEATKNMLLEQAKK